LFHRAVVRGVLQATAGRLNRYDTGTEARVPAVTETQVCCALFLLNRPLSRQVARLAGVSVLATDLIAVGQCNF
jgi:hypothetical protein